MSGPGMQPITQQQHQQQQQQHEKHQQQELHQQELTPPHQQQQNISLMQQQRMASLQEQQQPSVLNTQTGGRAVAVSASVTPISTPARSTTSDNSPKRARFTEAPNF